MHEEPQTPHVAASGRHPELAAEQCHVDEAYARLDAMRRSAASVAEAYAEVRRGGTHQARLERDVAFNHTQRRLAALEIGDLPLVFGRLDFVAAERCYVGRLGVDTEDHTPLVVDWRAPIAEPFYRATAVRPMGVARRRHFQTRGRELLGLDDEVFDQEATEAAGLELVGEGALLAALERERTGRMHDIVATIQSEQDEAIRADLPGVLVVTGGPGTGKTAVALHRAAYLLYTFRKQLGSRGVLFVGPNSMFLRYIDEVLPALGEENAHLATLRGLKPQVPVTGSEPDAVARLKGDARMATFVANALRDRERMLPREIVVVLDGHRLEISRRESREIVERVRRKRGTHNERRPVVVRMVVDRMIARYKRALVRAYRRSQPDRPVEPGADGETLAFDGLSATDEFGETVAELPIAAALARGRHVPEDWEQELGRRLRRTPGVREALERMWPILTGAELVHDVLSYPALIRSAARGAFSDAEVRALHRPRSASVREVAWTEADLPLIDEADALLGHPLSARPRRRRALRRADRAVLDTAGRVVDELGLHGHTSAADLVERFHGSNGEAELDLEPRTYGHVLVDEAQDLSAMQWRVLARRCPSGSMTLVGDFGQASRPGALSSWDEVLRQLPARVAPTTITLSVNYRTPAEIMDVAHRVLAVAAPGVEPARAVRHTGVAPGFVVAAPAGLVDEVARRVRAARAGRGTVAVIAPDAMHDALVVALADLGAAADTPDALDAPVTVLDALDAKGLEFDHVVVVEPAELVAPDRSGFRMLYVTLTRATQTLVVLHAGPLPEALEPR
ncbi:MAG: AAA family ATPase [Acidimicrobiia bacterium]